MSTTRTKAPASGQPGDSRYRRGPAAVTLGEDSVNRNLLVTLLAAGHAGADFTAEGSAKAREIKGRTGSPGQAARRHS